MSMFEKVSAASDSGSAKAYADLMDDNCVFVRNQTGTTMNKSEIVAMLEKMFASGGRFGKRRCIYENDDILVVHSVNDYPDGTREAVLAAYTLKGGKITRLETGATPVSK